MSNHHLRRTTITTSNRLLLFLHWFVVFGLYSTVLSGSSLLSWFSKNVVDEQQQHAQRAVHQTKNTTTTNANTTNTKTTTTTSSGGEGLEEETGEYGLSSVSVDYVVPPPPPNCVLFPPALNAIRRNEHEAYAAGIIPPNITTQNLENDSNDNIDNRQHHYSNSNGTAPNSDRNEDRVGGGGGRRRRHEAVDPIPTTTKEKDATTTTAAAAARASACSCTNANAGRGCCIRRLITMHKMGNKLSKDKFNHLRMRHAVLNETVLQRTTPHRNTRIRDFHALSRDFRDVYLFRNLYQALVSGYLYHKAGHECWLTSGSGVRKDVDAGKLFQGGLSYQLPPFDQSLLLYTDNSSGETKTHKLTICRYLSIVPEYDGLHAYIEWVFTKFYRSILDRYASSRILPSTLGVRTNVVCYRDLVHGSIERRRQIVQREILGFLLNNQTLTYHPSTDEGSRQQQDITTVNRTTSRLKEAFQEKDVQQYAAGHATSHDQTLRDHLFDVIQQVDADFYNHSIAWLASHFWPC